MGLFDSIFSKKSEEKILDGYWKTLTAYQPTFTSWGGQLYESELVRSAIDSRARHISKLKVEMIGSALPKLKTILKHRPNEFQTWSQFLYRLSTILDMHNTAFIVPIYNKNLETVGIFPVLPSDCEVLKDKTNNAWLRYRFEDGSKASIELSNCGIMTKFQYKSDLFGSTNTALDNTMKLIDIQDQGIKEAIKTSATYRFMAQVNNFTKAEDLAKERQRFTAENFAKTSRSGGLLLFPNTYTNIQQIKSSPYTVDAEQRKMIQQNVYNYFGVNEDVLQNKTIGDSWNAFYEGCVETFAIQLSEVLNKMIFSDYEISFGSEFVVSANRLQYMSNKDKLEVSSQMLDRGIFSMNEVRDIWNLPPIENGDVHIIRGEYYDINEKTDATGTVIDE
ncbi:MAG: phage portal protein [Clostridia bacterium]|nr:phage portal protein [Clostridia bacterium]